MLNSILQFYYPFLCRSSDVDENCISVAAECMECGPKMCNLVWPSKCWPNDKNSVIYSMVCVCVCAAKAHICECKCVSMSSRITLNLLAQHKVDREPLLIISKASIYVPVDCEQRRHHCDFNVLHRSRYARNIRPFQFKNYPSRPSQYLPATQRLHTKILYFRVMGILRWPMHRHK